jgi:hypothetical protein
MSNKSITVNKHIGRRFGGARDIIYGLKDTKASETVGFIGCLFLYFVVKKKEVKGRQRK